MVSDIINTWIVASAGMKTRILILLLFLVSCANNTEAQKYRELRKETNDLIAKADLVRKDQQAKIDSLLKLRTENIVNPSYSISVWGLQNETNEADEIRMAMVSLSLALGTQALNYSVLEKAYTRFGYLFQGKRSIKVMYIQRMGDTNKEIDEIIGGHSTQDSINKYLSREMQ